jgi:flagellar biosynthesis/type III secretory pathway chaperone
MNELLQNLINSLREELKQYGELLALLDAQQEHVIHRMTEEMLAAVCALQNQGEAIRAARLEREQRQRELAQSLRLPSETGMGSLVRELPNAYQPLVRALVEENNELLVRVRQRARQNHVLMSRAVEMMGQFMSSFCGVSAPTYNPDGVLSGCASRPLYESVC